MTEMHMKRLALGFFAIAAALGAANEASAQEIQLTGPLAGAPAYRRLRLHREGRFDLAPAATFTLLDEFRRGIMPGLRANYHFFDWLGVGLFGGYMVTYNTGLTDELQEKAVNDRGCEEGSPSLACRRSQVNLCRAGDHGEECLNETQLGSMVWYVAPQITFVPFRGKFSLFGAAFLDADISLFLGAGIVGIDERASCEAGDCPDTFELTHRVTAGPTFGLGFNFYPVWQGEDGAANSWIGFGAEFRATPFEWNTSGFDVASEEDEFPDDAVNNHDRSLHVNPMLSVFVSFQLPPEVQVSD
jgi:hypothetical protein